MRIYRCDRCGREVAFIWNITLSVENPEPRAQYIKTKKIEICDPCRHLFRDWIKEGTPKDFS
jgi:ribosomal protein S14